MKYPTVSVVIPVYNVKSILKDVLSSLIVQTYPIHEIILIDNHSTDTSVQVADEFIKTHKKIPIRIIKRKQTYGISHSYNLGAQEATSEYVVTLHSDSMLPTKFELSRLMKPFVHNTTDYVAAMPIVVHRKLEWDAYNFWQKCLFAQVVGRKLHSLNGKFDAYNRKIFLSLGGYDVYNFHHNLGSEDADMHFRLSNSGKIARTSAEVIHLHGNDDQYSLGDFIRRRKFLTLSYVQQMRLHYKEMGVGQLFFFGIKPLIVMVAFFGVLNPLYLLPLVAFPFWYMSSMFFNTHVQRDKRILVLPFIVVYLMFAETYWLLISLFNKRYTL